MSFLNASTVLIITTIVILLGTSWLLRRAKTRRRQLIEAITGPRLASRLSNNVSHPKRRWRAVLLLVALVFLSLAMARPWWGRRLVHTPKRSRDILIALDCSRSMLARDIAPNRLKHAQWWIRELVNQNHGDRFGIIAFAGEAFLQCPLTQDRNTLFQFLDDTDTGSVPLGGTNIETALKTARKAFEGAEGTHRAVIIISDGEELEGSAKEQLEFFRSSNIPLFVVGLGDPSRGSVIQLNDNTFLRDENQNIVTTKLNETALKNLSAATGGIYVRSTTVSPNINPVARRVRALVPTEMETQSSSHRPIERYQLPLFVAIVLLIIRLFIGERTSTPHGINILLALGLLTLATNSSQAQIPVQTTATDPLNSLMQPAGPIPEPQNDLEQQLRSEIESIQKQLEAAPPTDKARLHFNLGYNQHQLAELSPEAALDAIKSYETALRLAGDNDHIRTSALQNLGIIHHQLGRQKLLESPQECLVDFKTAQGHYMEAMRHDSTKNVNAHNLEKLLVEKKKAEEWLELTKKMKEQLDSAREQTSKANETQQEANESSDPKQRQQKQQEANEQTQKAQQAVQELQQQAQSTLGDDVKEQLTKAQEALDDAVEAQQQPQPDTQKAQEKLREAMQHLGIKEQQPDQSGDQSGDSKQDQQKQDGEQQNQENQPNQADKSDSDKQQPLQTGDDESQTQPEETAQATAGEEAAKEEFNEQRARAILMQMGQDEKDLREALKQRMRQQMKTRPVKKDW